MINDFDTGKLLKSLDMSTINKQSGHECVVPRWKLLDETCYDRKWCGPIAGKVVHWPHGVVSERKGGQVQLQTSGRRLV